MGLSLPPLARLPLAIPCELYRTYTENRRYWLNAGNPTADVLERAGSEVSGVARNRNQRHMPTRNLYDGSHRRGRRSQEDRKRLFHRISLWRRCFQIDANLVGLARESLLVHHQEVHALGCVRYHKDHIPFLGAVALHYQLAGATG